jgi:DNA end-binding protein Ku
MPRATWTGTITLGLLNPPVSLYTGTTEERIRFKNLCPVHRSPTEQPTYCLKGGERVSRADLVKGFEIEPDKTDPDNFVVLTEADLERAALPLSRMLEIEVCVPEPALDFRYFEAAYIAGPPKRDPGRVFALLHAALASTGHVGIGRITLRTRQHLAAVRVLGPFIAVHLMHWPDELVRLDAFAPASAEVKPAELALATQLVAALAGPFDPTAFVDQHRANVMALIEARMNGEPDVSFTPQAEPDATGGDLMAMLSASLTAAGERKAA